MTAYFCSDRMDLYKLLTFLLMTRKIMEENMKPINNDIDVRIKIAALWIMLMILYLYNDFFSLFTPGALEEMIEGMMGPFPVTQTSLIGGAVLMIIPILMIYNTLVLKERINRISNVTVSSLYIVVMVVSVIGEWWFYILMGVVEIIINLLIIYHALVWQKKSS